MKKVLNVVCFMILIIIIILNLFSIILVNVLKKDYVNFFGYTYFEVKSGSMAPTIKINDIIIVKTNKEYQVGDIVTYKDNDSFITHRIEEIKEDKYITKGDANDAADKPIKENQIIGKVIKIFSEMHYITRVLQNPITLIIIFVIGILFVIYSSFKKTKE